MKTESRLLAVIAAAALFAFSLANPAFAETQEFTQAQEQSVRSNMTSHGIDGPTQDSLIAEDLAAPGLFAPDFLDILLMAAPLLLLVGIIAAGIMYVVKRKPRQKPTRETSEAHESRATD